MDETEVPKVGDGVVSGLNRNDELNKLHRLRPEQIHRWTATAATTTAVPHDFPALDCCNTLRVGLSLSHRGSSINLRLKPELRCPFPTAQASTSFLLFWFFLPSFSFFTVLPLYFGLIFILCLYASSLKF